jgi:hypothetical protein
VSDDNKSVIIDGVEYVPKVAEPDVEIIPHKEAKLTARMDEGWIEYLLESDFPGTLIFTGCTVSGVLQAGKFKEVSLSFEHWEVREED